MKKANNSYMNLFPIRTDHRFASVQGLIIDHRAKMVILDCSSVGEKLR